MQKRQQPAVVLFLAICSLLRALAAPLPKQVGAVISNARERTDRLDIELRYTLPATADAALAAMRTFKL